MLASPNNRQLGLGIRFLTIAFSVATLFLVATKLAGQGTLVVYMVLLAILMMFCQKATNYSISDGAIGRSGKDEYISYMDIYSAYFLALIVIFSRSIFGIYVPNAIYFFADFVAVGSILFGLISIYRRSLD